MTLPSTTWQSEPFEFVVAQYLEEKQRRNYEWLREQRRTIVSTEPLRNHLRFLVATGHSAADIAKRVGKSRKAVTRLLDERTRYITIYVADRWVTALRMEHTSVLWPESEAA